jgi:signal transduction histidine kinase
LTTPPSDLPAAFVQTLRESLAGGDEAEAALLSAYELGRRALGEGLGILDVAGLLHEALVTACQDRPEDTAQTIRAAEGFALECLSSFEMAHRAAREANVALRRMNEMLEEQRRRISHEMHDQAGQLLASVYLALDELARELPPAVLDRIQTVKGRLDQIEDELRRLSHELRPTILDDLGLVAALDVLAEGVGARHNLTIDVKGPREARFPSDVETALYRIAQEALNNAVKHARASNVELSVAAGEGKVCCSIRDNGVGIPTVSRGQQIGGIGLIGMRERLVPLGGTLRIDSAPGAGTEIRATIPLPRDAGAGPVLPSTELGPSPY